MRVVVIVRERSCPECGSSLRSWESAEGAIWECRTHGVKDWLFDSAFRAPPSIRTLDTRPVATRPGDDDPGSPPFRP